jgi:hypothetical protein
MGLIYGYNTAKQHTKHQNSLTVNSPNTEANIQKNNGCLTAQVVNETIDCNGKQTWLNEWLQSCKNEC